MRNFNQFIRGEKETRLDIFCYKLDKKESEELSEILKTMRFTFCYVKSDSIFGLFNRELCPGEED